MSDSDRPSSQSPTSLFDGLEQLVDALGSLAEQEGHTERSVHVGADGTEAVVGARIRTNIGGVSGESSPADSATDDPEAPRARRPSVDVDAGEKRIRVVAEMPGVGPDALEWSLEGRTLTLAAQTERRRYRRVVQLPRPVESASAVVTVENGLAELSFDASRPDA
jgi:HSP20 family molecular chaperone IbpA